MAISRPNEEHDLRFDKPVARWDEGPPLGNGLTGLLIWGDGNPLRLSLDRGDLWDKRVAEETLAENFTYAELIRLVNAGEHDEVKRRFEECWKKPTPTKIPAGRIELDFGSPCDSAQSHLSLYSAVAEVRLSFGEREREGVEALPYEVECTVRAFTHATDRIGHISIKGSAPLPAINVKPPEYAESGGTGLEAGSLELLGYPRAMVEQDGDLLWFHQKTMTDLEYAVVVARREIGAGDVELTYVIAASLDGPNWLEDAKAAVLRAAKVGFEKAAVRHRKWWTDFWAKSAIDLPDKEFEKQWYLTNYLLASCSRLGAPPMPLQGIWTADEGMLPPWKGDYHSDLNTQLSYWHYLKANHLDEGKSFVDFLWELAPQGREFARTFYDAPGLCMPSVMSIDGKALCGWVMYSFSITTQAWLCQAFDHHWLFSGDNRFLEERAYPYLRESAECICRWLSEGPYGKLRLPLSSSPEIHDNSPEAWLTPNANFDLSLLKYLFGALERMAKELGNGEEDRWQQLANRLPELALDERNGLMLSPDESLRESHRHHSHAMAIYPLNLLDYHGSDSDKAIIDATIANMEDLGTGWWVGYSFPWMANLYARQGKGNGAYYQLKLFWESFCSQNGFHLNGDFKNHGVSAYHYRPFTLEGNMAAADALQEMLLQTHHGIIRVFPAIPDEWRESRVSFQNLRAEGAVLVSAKWAGGDLTVSLLPETGGLFYVQNDFGCGELQIEDKSGNRKLHCGVGETFELRLGAYETCTIRKSQSKGTE